MQDILLFIQHHPGMIAAFAIILVLLIVMEFIKLKRGANQLSPAQAVQYMNRQQTPVVDLRTEDAFAAGHITGAISIPLGELEVKLKKIEKFKAQPVILVCAMGADSSRAAALLMKQGYQPHILAGGMRAWREANLPVVKGK